MQPKLWEGARGILPAIGLLCLLLTPWAALAQEPYVQQAELVPADSGPGDGFGGSVVLSADGNTALVPATGQDCAAGTDCGAVYVFAREGGVWVQQGKLQPAEVAAGDQVADVAVSADGNLALLGVPSRDCAAGPDCGAVYVFERSGGVWNEVQKLPLPEILSSNIRIGTSVTLSDDGTLGFVGILQGDGGCPIMSLGCDGIATYRRTGGVFVEFQPISTLVKLIGNILVSSDGETVLIPTGFPGQTTAYDGIFVFRWNGTDWIEQPKIPETTASALSFIPLALSSDGNTVLIAETSEDGGAFARKVSVWVRSGSNWTLQTVLVEDAVNVGSGALSFDGNTAVIGGANGTARVFGRQGGAWVEGQTVTTPDPAATEGVVSLSDDARTLLLGAAGIGCTGADCLGGAYIFVSELPFSPEIPTASEVGLALLALLLAGVGAARLRRV
jgi:hypothetical protein